MVKEIKNEAKKNYEKGIKKIPWMTWIALPCVLLIVAFIFSLNFYLEARDSGSTAGSNLGKTVGRVIGSVEGFAQGQEGFNAGIEAGLSAQDTTVDITQLRGVKNLEVLVVSGTFSDVLKIKEGKDYAALLTQKYNAVYAIDLNTAEVVSNNNGLVIIVDPPKVDFIPIGDVKKVSEYQRPGFIIKPGSIEAGYVAADNSSKMIRENAQKKLEADASLMNAARASAEKQISQLVSNVSLSSQVITVEFRGDEK